jgi:predicted nucleotidyltransferase component of viral defense system
MAQKQIKNISASVRERLLQLSKKTDKSFDAILRLYGQERFLYRLSVSPYNKNFILKGGLLFLSLPMPIRRPTVDIDFSGRAVADDHDKLKLIFAEIADIECSDGIKYHAGQMTLNKIKEESDFTGIRIIIPAEVAKARVRLQIDIVFGDSLTKEPRIIEFPTLLDLPKPNIFVYSMETVIAEKFQAIVSRMTATSRMKDFFDIASLAEVFPFEGKELMVACKKTFAGCGTELKQCAEVFNLDFANNPSLGNLWKGFLSRNNLPYDGDPCIFPHILPRRYSMY